MGEYRDTLGAAHQRIGQLEEELACVRESRAAEPASAADLEAARIQNDLLRLEMEWRSEGVNPGGLDARRRTRAVAALVLLGLAPAVFGLFLAVLDEGVGILPFALVSAVLAAAILIREQHFRRRRAEYLARRRPLDAMLARVEVPAARTRVAVRIDADEEAEAEIDAEETAGAAPEMTLGVGGRARGGR